MKMLVMLFTSAIILIACNKNTRTTLDGKEASVIKKETSAENRKIKQLSLKVTSQTSGNLAGNQQKKDYPIFLTDIKKHKQSLQTTAQAADYLFHLLNNNIADYWIGTKWDFNGVSRTPQQGEVACGYFITNVLTDLGFKLKRVKLAQAPSSQMIKQLTVNVRRFGDFKKMLVYLRTQPNNTAFIIGLDFHTGFLLKTEHDIYFLHSNYINRQGVVKEKAVNSQALRASKSFMLGNITDNKQLMKQWIQ